MTSMIGVGAGTEELRSGHVVALTLNRDNVIYQAIPHELCRCEVKDVHGLQSFVSTHSEESGSLLFVHCLQ